MADTPHNVILSGIKPGQDPATVRERLGAILGRDAAAVQKLLDSAPVLLTKDSNAVKARQLRDAIRAAGAVCRTEPPLPNSPAPRAQTVIKRCPKCGYAATRRDDPLITAFDGQGECPQCRVIPAKFEAGTVHAQATPDPVLTASVAQEPRRLRGSTDWRGTRVLIYALLIVALPALTIWQMLAFLSKQVPVEDGESPGLIHPRAAQATDAETKQRAEMEAIHERLEDDGRAKFSLASGETRQFVLKTWLPLMHSDDFLPLSFALDSSEARVIAISSEADLPDDERLRAAWQRLGIKPSETATRAQIIDGQVEIAPERIPLYESLAGSNEGWKLSVMSGYWNVRAITRDGDSPALFSVGRPLDLVEEMRRNATPPTNENLQTRKRDYLVYALSLHFALTAPTDSGSTGAVVMAVPPQIAFYGDGDTRRLIGAQGQGGLLMAADGRVVLGSLPIAILRLKPSEKAQTWQLSLDHSISNEQWKLEAGDHSLFQTRPGAR